MRTTLVNSPSLFVLLAMVLAIPRVSAADALWSADSSGKLVCDRVLEDFSSTAIGSFPKGWHTKYKHNAEEARIRGLYFVEDDGGKRVLHATHGSHTITIALEIDDWDLKRYTHLQWRWKGIKLPTGGDESNRSTNDSTASVYVVWKASWPVKAQTLRLAWSSTLPVGKHISKRLGNDHVVIMETGHTHQGQWRTATANIAGMYRRYLDDDSASPAGLAITTDADDTDSKAEALYADFRLCRVDKP